MAGRLAHEGREDSGGSVELSEALAFINKVVLEVGLDLGGG